MNQMDLMRTLAGSDLSRRRLWTRQEFERAGEMGLFGPEERLELIEGEIFQKVSQKPPHAVSAQLAEDYLRSAFPTGHVVRVQKPLALSDISEPEPDIAVVTGSARDYLEAHPTCAILAVEVARTSLTWDRNTKASLYARAGVSEYWIINVRDRVLEIHREPGPMTEQPLGFAYRSITRHPESDIIAPLSAPHAQVRVADLLP